MPIHYINCIICEKPVAFRLKSRCDKHCDVCYERLSPLTIKCKVCNKDIHVKECCDKVLEHGMQVCSFSCLRETMH